MPSSPPGTVFRRPPKMIRPSSVCLIYSSSLFQHIRVGKRRTVGVVTITCPNEKKLRGEKSAPIDITSDRFDQRLQFRYESCGVCVRRMNKYLASDRSPERRLKCVVQ